MFATMARQLAEADGVRPTLQRLVTGHHSSLRLAAAVMAHQITAKPASLSASSDAQLFDEVARIAGAAGSDGVAPRGDVVHCPDLGPRSATPRPDDMLRPTPIRSVLSLGAAPGRSTRTRSVGRVSWPTTRPSRSTRRPTPTGRTTSRSRCSATASRGQRSVSSSSGLRLTPAQAFDLLRVMSQHTNRKLADLAEHLVETGELPGRRRPAPRLTRGHGPPGCYRAACLAQGAPCGACWSPGAPASSAPPSSPP